MTPAILRTAILKMIGYSTYMCYTFVVTEETRIMCVNVYYTAVFVPGDPLRSYHAVLNKRCPL